jgi:hypothetical protein
VSFWGWESAKRAGKRHLYLEVAGIVFLALLVLFEALEERNTTLAQAFKRAGTLSLAALVVAEIARIAYGLRSDKLTEAEAEAKLKAAEAKIAILHSAVARRRLTSKQYKELVEKLSPLVMEESDRFPKVAVIAHSDEDLEQSRFANQIAGALEETKMIVLRVRSDNVTTLGLFGGYLLSTPDEESRSRMAAIANALALIGVDFKWWNDPNNELYSIVFWPSHLYDRQRTVLIVVMPQPKPELPDD